MRLVTLLLCASLAALALLIYEVKHETRALDRRADALREAIKAERDAIAVLRAEWSLLNRPERVERLARKHLGLDTLPTERLITPDRLDIVKRRPSGAPGPGLPIHPPSSVAH